MANLETAAACDSKKLLRILVVVAVLLIACVSALWMIGKRTLDSHECFVSITAREMLTSGDWTMPTCNGQIRMNKTPLSYWAVAGLGKLTGTIDEFTARLPSAIFGILSAAGMFYFVSRLISFRIAAVSTLVWVTSLGYVRETHMARPDMALAFFVTLCFLSFYAAMTAGNRPRQIAYSLIFWMSFSFGMLAKGPAPLPLIGLPVLFYITIFRRWSVLLKLLPIAGLVIFLVIVLPWPIAIAQRVNWDLMVWKREFVDRLSGDYSRGSTPFYFYLLIMFKFMAPWVAFVPVALLAPFYRVWDEKRKIMRFFWLCFVVNFALLTIMPCRRQHYLLPVIPLMAILVGIVLDDMVFSRRAFSHGFVKNIMHGHTVGLILVAIVGTVAVRVVAPALFRAMVMLAVATILLVVVVEVMFARGKVVPALGMLSVGLVIWVVTLYTGHAAVFNIDRYSRDFAGQISQIVPAGEKLVAYRAISSRFVHYFGQVVPIIEDKSQLQEYYDRGAWVVCTYDHLQELVPDKLFRRVYYKERPKDGKEDAGGVLLHKSASVVEESNVGTAGSAATLPFR